MTPGQRFRLAVEEERPLRCVGATNAYHAKLAEATGYRSLYVSGGGVAAGSYGIPDLGITALGDVLTDVRRITDITDLPLLVDIDTGWGGAFNIARTVKSMIKCEAAALHIEDQVLQKRCGHCPDKAVVPTDEMVDRIKAAVDARTDESFVIMARTDAIAGEGHNAGIDRACAYVEAGADMVFPEAVTDLDFFREFAHAVGVPILANITELGNTPLFTTAELASADVSIVLYPLSVFRADNAAVLNVYNAIRNSGTQQDVVPLMQTGNDPYNFPGYHDFEQTLDQLFAQDAD